MAENIGHKIIYMQCVDSTNEEAKRGGDNGASHGTVYVAEEQTAGKGRRGRSWLSESAENLYFTLLLKPDIAPEKATMLTLVMAHAVSQAIEKMTGLVAGIKWPNDIVVNKKKVCGILSEMKLDKGRSAYCVIGVGINIGQTEFPEELQDKATSLWAELMAGREEDISGAKTIAVPGKNQILNKQTLLQEILKVFEGAYQAFLKTEDLSPMLDAYNAHLVNKNQNVRVLEPAGAYEGVALGVTSTGELLVEKNDKTVQKVYAGEVSVRGLYGYV